MHKRKSRKLSDSEEDFVGEDSETSSTSNPTPPTAPPSKRSKISNNINNNPSNNNNSKQNTSHNRSQQARGETQQQTTQSASHLQPPKQTKSTNNISHWTSLLKLNYEGVIHKVIQLFLEMQ